MKQIYIKEVTPDDDVREKMIRGAGYSYRGGMMMIHKHGGQYTCFCTQCGRFMELNEKQKKQMRYAYTCPLCYEQFRRVSFQTEYNFQGWIEYQSEGFCVWSKVNTVDRTINGSVDHVYHIDGNKRYKRLCNCTTAGYPYYDGKLTQWRISKSRCLPYCFMRGLIELYDLLECTSKKDILERTFNRPDLKSNQKKLIIDNIVNKDMVDAIVLFDLKDINDVYRNRVFIRKNSYSFSCYSARQMQLNVFYLNYFARNKIPMMSYLDYLRQCDDLGYKPGKPADFNKEHEKLTQIIVKKREAERNRELAKQNRKIRRISQKYEHLKYTKGGLIIEPFKSYAEIRKTSDELHNCMASNYTKRYAEGELIILHVFDKDEELAGVEVVGNKIVQFRGKYNHNPEDNLESFVRNWTKKKELQYAC